MTEARQRPSYCRKCCGLIEPQSGYILLPVVLAITLIAVIAFMMNLENAINLKTLNNDIEATQADYIAQAGMAHANWYVQRSGCMGDATMSSVPLGAHSYNATVTGGGGSNTAYNLSVDQDAWIRSDAVDQENGGNADQHIRFESGNIEQALFRFDLSSLSAGARINSASAWFYVKGGSGHPEGPLTVHKVTADWSEAGATWSNMNGSFETQVLGSIAAQSSGDVWVRVNLTAQVQGWVNGEPNYGIMLGSTAEGVHTMYVSREGPSNQHPRLQVVVGNAPASPVNIQATGTLANGLSRTLTRSAVKAYQPASTLTLQPNAGNGKDVFLKEDAASNNHGVSSDLWVESSGSGAGDNSLLQFNLNGIARDAKITSATLEVFQYWSFTPGGTVGIHRVTHDWVEGSNDGSSGTGATWNERFGSMGY